MLKTYIFNESTDSWIEEHSILLYQDLCIFLDEERNKIYIWNGPKSSKEKLEKGKESLVKLISNYPNRQLEIEILSKKIPALIKDKLDLMLETVRKEEQAEKYKFSSFLAVRIYLIALIITVLLPIISLINLYFSLTWTFTGGTYHVSSTIFETWILISFVLILISLGSLVVGLIVGICESESQVIIFSLIGILISTGLSIYLSLGEFLFQFEEGSTPTLYLIRPVDLMMFLLIVSFSSAIFVIPNFIKLMSFMGRYRSFIF